MCIASDKNGNQLLEVIQGNEDEMIANKAYRPLTVSLVVVKSPDGFMLLKNKYRNQWELAGGVIEQGETPRECAVRECFEESGYNISDLRFSGMVKWYLVPDFFSKENRIEYCTLYSADLQDIKMFQENEEMMDICWYNIGQIIENANEMDVKLLEYYRS